MTAQTNYVTQRERSASNFLVILFTLFIVFISLFIGDNVADSVNNVLQVFSGNATNVQTIVVWQWRASRVFAALIIGASLALSGAIFQSMVRNPLGSPDVTGFNVGAYTGVLIVIALFGNWFWITVSGAMLGGLFSALLVYLFAYKEGYSGFRLIIVGIGISATLTAFNQWLTLSVSLEIAMSAALWSAGTLNGMTWAKILPTSGLLLIFFVAAAALNTRMKILEMGDDTAAALGISVNKVRIALMIVGVALTAITTAITGPIAFVALAAPQIAKRLNKHGDASLLSVACVGALLLVTADFIGQYARSNATLPVGLVTLSLGGFYLLYLIIRQGKIK